MKRLHRRFPNPVRTGFTIIESLVVLVVLAVLSMLIIALIKHQMKPEFPSRLNAVESPAAPAAAPLPSDQPPR